LLKINTGGILTEPVATAFPTSCLLYQQIPISACRRNKKLILTIYLYSSLTGHNKAFLKFKPIVPRSKSLRRNLGLLKWGNSIYPAGNIECLVDYKWFGSKAET